MGKGFIMMPSEGRDGQSENLRDCGLPTVKETEEIYYDW